MIYLKDILSELKVDLTRIAHTQKSLQWVYHGYIPIEKIINPKCSIPPINIKMLQIVTIYILLDI